MTRAAELATRPLLPDEVTRRQSPSSLSQTKDTALSDIPGGTAGL
jgi:hypothetical protein